MSNEKQLYSNETTVFVGRLQRNVTEKEIEDFFSEAGPIEYVRIIPKRASNFAYVQFETADAMNKAVEYSLRPLNGREVYVAKARPFLSPEERAPTARLFAKGLGTTVTEELVSQAFGTYGKVTNVQLLKNNSNDELTGSAFVQFENVEDATKALSELNNKLIGDKPLIVEYLRPRPPRRPRQEPAFNRPPRQEPEDIAEKREKTTTCFVGNLSFDATADDVKSLFSECGPIVDVSIIQSRGHSRGFGYIQFETHEACEAAMKMSGTSHMDREIRVDFAVTKPGENRRRRSPRRAPRAPAQYTPDLEPNAPRSRPRRTRAPRGAARHGSPAPSTDVFVGNLPFSATAEEVQQVFSPIGPCTVEMVTRPSGDFKGFCFVHFTTQQAADSALNQNGVDFGGRRMHLSYKRAAPAPTKAPAAATEATPVEA